jgi:signal recognition particle receptor subunit beta
MVVFNYTGRELSGKIVYYGPALSGKTTNLEQIYGRTPADTRGKMVSMKTKAERTLFFDLLPISKGKIGDFNVRFLLYTVPGQVYYNATRKLVLKGADAIVFVADSQRSQLAANIDSLRNLRTNLLEYGMCLDDLPWVISYNKRDMPDAMPMDELDRELNPYGVPSFPGVAVTGEGVFEAFEKVSEMLMERLEAQLRGDSAKSEPRAPAPSAMPSPVDPDAVRQVREAIQGGQGLATPAAPPPLPPAAAVPPPPPLPPAPPSPQVDPTLQPMLGLDLPGPPTPPAPPAPPAAAPFSPAAPAVDIVAAPNTPLSIEKVITVPISASDLQGGARKIRLILDVTLDPQN